MFSFFKISAAISLLVLSPVSTFAMVTVESTEDLKTVQKAAAKPEPKRTIRLINLADNPMIEISSRLFAANLLSETERGAAVIKIMEDPILSNEDRMDVARKIAKNPLLSEEVRKKAVEKLPEHERLITRTDKNDY